MRRFLVTITLVAFAQAAAAEPSDAPHEDRDATGVQLSYRMTFGGAIAAAAPHGIALAVRHPGTRADARPLLEGGFGAAGLQRLALNGINLLADDFSRRQTGEPRPLPPAATGEIKTLPFPAESAPPPAPKKTYLGKLTGVQWLGIGVTVLALGAVVADSGGGGGGEPAPQGSGGS